jgi:hypothetical protein
MDKTYTNDLRQFDDIHNQIVSLLHKSDFESIVSLIDDNLDSNRGILRTIWVSLKPFYNTADEYHPSLKIKLNEIIKKLKS